MDQISFREVDGTIVFFNEAETVCDLDAPEPQDLDKEKTRGKKRTGKKAEDLSALNVNVIEHYLSDEETAKANNLKFYEYFEISVERDSKTYG